MGKSSAESWIFETDDQELADAVGRFLDIQSRNFAYAKRVGVEIDPESIAIYHDWVGYWYKLRNGHRLELSELQAICGYTCQVQICQMPNGSRKYRVLFNPDMEVWYD